jgi:hypothetical protein
VYICWTLYLLKTWIKYYFIIISKYYLNFLKSKVVGFLNGNYDSSANLHDMWLQQFASKHKPQTFSRVCLRLKRDVYRWKWNVSLLMWRVIVQWPNSVIFHVLMWFRVRFSVSKLTIYCKSDQTCLYSYFLWLERIIMGLEILKRARRHIKTWQLRQK